MSDNNTGNVTSVSAWASGSPHEAALEALVVRLADELTHIIPRFERCVRHGGSDEEYVRIASERYRAALSDPLLAEIRGRG